ncbi:hypothetical protein M0802_012348 [Mischocyttarus mexicanus]|nr:hypothetical protein M0802_012348 [Mischocyttarus mexicanus]
MAMKKCSNGMLSEIKYDGERVQVHKKGCEFQYFSRSLKPVLAHKIRHFKDYIPKAFPNGDDLILDSEILLIDNETGKPLPFGSLGKHKKSEFKDANVCLFVFDCIYYNGEILIDKSMQERRQILKKSMTEIPNRIMLSEAQEVHVVPKRAALLLDQLMIALQKVVDNHGRGNIGSSKSLTRSAPPIQMIPSTDEQTMDLQRRGQAKSRVYWRCYFNAVTCFKRK